MTTQACTYCGELGETEEDHVIPSSWLREKRRRYARDWTVPACRECNCLLGSKLYFSVPQRAGYLASVYRERYAHIFTAMAVFEPTPKSREIGRLVRHLHTIAAKDDDYLMPSMKHVTRPVRQSTKKP